MQKVLNCPHCGEVLAVESSACAQCGARYGHNRGVLFIALALFLVGSGLWRDGWLMPIVFWLGSAVAAKLWLKPVWMIRDEDLA
jgi:hypothetical protein